MSEIVIDEEVDKQNSVDQDEVSAKSNGSEEKSSETNDKCANEYPDDNCSLFYTARFCELLKIIAENESQEKFLTESYKRIDLTALGPRQYLEETVVPILMPAMEYLVRERPPEPINALCVYLLKHKSKYEKYCNTEPPHEDKEDSEEN